MVEITLSKGLRAMVDDEDAEHLQGRNWFAKRNRQNGSFYAQANDGKLPDGRKVTLLMHRILLDAPIELDVDHINHDTLDNRRSNLRLATRSENLQNRREITVKSRSGVRNVWWDSRACRFVVYLCLQGRKVYGGRFSDLEQAKGAAIRLRRAWHPFATN